MSLRVPAAIAVGLSLIILPVIIVRAQAEGDTEAPPSSEVLDEVAEPTTADTAQQDTEAPAEPTTPEADPAPAEEGSVLGAGPQPKHRVR